MPQILSVLLMVNSAFIAYQDFRDRAIVVWAILVLGALALFQGLVFREAQDLFTQWSVNACILGVQVLGIHLYARLRFGTFKVMDKYFGWGDLVIMGVFALAFSPYSFLVFIIASVLLAMVWYFLRSAFNRPPKTIPFAGMMALVFMVLQGWFLFSSQLNGLSYCFEQYVGL